MASSRLEQARLRRDLAYSEFLAACESPSDPFGLREVQIQKALTEAVTAEAEANRLWQRQELVRRWREMRAKNDSGHPVVGVVPPQAGQPYEPHVAEPEAFDPGETVEDWQPEGNTNVVHALPRSRKVTGGPADFNDPNPVDAETVYLLMSKNFPPDSIQWVKRATWQGPIWVPWQRIDDDGRESWAATKQPKRVKEFEGMIRAHSGHVSPSILVQEASSPKAFIVDGHHRALAHENLGQKVLAYLGTIRPQDRLAAEETHSHQIHSGTDPRNT